MAQEKAIFMYGIRDKKTGKVVNRKSNSSNAFYARKCFAEQKAIKGKEEIVTYQLVEIHKNK